MSDVLELEDVSVVREGRALVDQVSWSVKEGERWVILGPNGAGKTTLMSIASAQMYPTSGLAGILGEVLGAVDVFELRPRIGLTSAVFAEQIPRSESVRDLVVTAAYGVVGRWHEQYDAVDHERAEALRPAGNDESILRWNTCVRLLGRHEPSGRSGPREYEPALEE